MLTTVAVLVDTSSSPIRRHRHHHVGIQAPRCFHPSMFESVPEVAHRGNRQASIHSDRQFPYTPIVHRHTSRCCSLPFASHRPRRVQHNRPAYRPIHHQGTCRCYNRRQPLSCHRQCMRWSHSIRRRDIHKRVVVLSLVDRRERRSRALRHY